ncbi:MAG: aldehyde ferredoxin oxidoreductase family protein [Anaerolineae bacterium]|jgi:aldehyde:ferredoxin oxidoreductase
MSNFLGRVLSVDLTSGQVKRWKVGEKTATAYIGGRGLGARLLLDELPAHTHPLSGQNVLMFVTGPLTGTPFPGSGKYVVITRSPATGAFLDSYSSGLLAPALRFVGIDVLLVTGRAPVPSYLWIKENEVEVRSAEDLWGLDAFEAETRLRDLHGHDDVGIAVIGPAGENLVKYATIGSDFYRHAGRGGCGAVMGSKNLKAVAVRGTGGIPLADPSRVLELQAEQVKRLPDKPGAQVRIKYGTTSTFPITNAAGMLPTRNFQFGTFPEAVDRLDAEGIRKITIGNAGCYGCIVPCSRLVRVQKDEQEISIEGPEYETLGMLGSNLGISDPAFVVEANLLCDQLGIDTISAGAVLGFAMECVERGLLKNPSVTDLRFGSQEAALRALRDIAYRSGAGDLMAEGVRTMAEEIRGGSDRFAMHVKGLEFPAYDPRAGFGTGLTYAVTGRGACHRRAWPPAREVLGGVPPYTIEGKAAMVKEMSDERTLLHSFLVCDYAGSGLGIPFSEYIEFIAAVSGHRYTENDLQEAADRIETTIRIFNVREGLGRKDDTLPTRILEEPLPDGPASGQLFGREGLETMKDEYYVLRGWDEQGVPLPGTLQRYGISSKESAG